MLRFHCLLVLGMVLIAGLMSVPELKEKDPGDLQKHGKYKWLPYYKATSVYRARMHVEHQYKGWHIEWFGKELFPSVLQSPGIPPGYEMKRVKFDSSYIPLSMKERYLLREQKLYLWTKRVEKIMSHFPFVKRMSVGPRRCRILVAKVYHLLRRNWDNGVALYFKHYTGKYKRYIMIGSIVLVLLTLNWLGISQLLNLVGMVGATIYYLDTSAGTDGDGTLESPFNSEATFKTYFGVTGDTGRLKCGTTGNLGSMGAGADNLTLESYGVGAKPDFILKMDMWADGLVVRDLALDGSGTGGSYMFTVAGDIDDIEIYNVDITNKIGFAFGSPYTSTNISLHDFTIDNDGTGLNMESYNGDYVENVEIYNFDINCNSYGTSDGISIHSNEHSVVYGGNINIHDGIVSNCAENCIDLTGMGYGQVYNVETDNGAICGIVVGFASGNNNAIGVQLHHNYNHGSPNNGEIVLEAIGPVYVYKNFVYLSDANRGISLIDQEDNSVGYYIEGNTVVAGPNVTNGLIDVHRENSALILEAIVQNNIFTTSESSLPNVYSFATYGPTDAFFTSSNNIMYNPAGDPTPCAGYNWTTWNALFTEASKDDPMLVDRTVASGELEDAYIASGSSSAYNTASYTSTGTYYNLDGTPGSGGVEGITDILGNVITDNGCIGFHEYAGTGGTTLVYVNDLLLDLPLQYIIDNCDRVDICSAQPTSYSEATTDGNVSLGYKTSPTIGSLGDGTPSGRKITLSQVTGGTVTESDTATHLAFVDTVGEDLLLVMDLDAGVVVTDGHTWSTNGAVNVTLPDPA